MLTDVLTGPLRRKLYITYALVGVTIGATQVGFASADAGQPTWLTVALAVFAFLGTAFGFTASANVPAAAGRNEAPEYDPPTTTDDEDQTTPEQRQPIPGTTLPGLYVER